VYLGALHPDAPGGSESDVAPLDSTGSRFEEISLNSTHRSFVLLALCVLIPLGAVQWIAPGSGTAATTPVTEVARFETPALPEPTTAAASPEPLEHAVERFFMGQGGTLAAALDRLGLDPDKRRLVLQAADRHLELRRLSPRTGFAALRDAENRLVSLAIRSDPERFLRITLPEGDRELRAELLPLALETRVETTGGVVSSSVAQALGHAAHSHVLTQAYADIFQWDVDLLVDPRPGDEVRVVYEVETLGAVPADLPRFGDAAAAPGEFVGLSRILAATYHGSNADAKAFWVEDGPSRGNYYDDEGRPLRKSFLKSPLNYRRISSGFSRARRHPVTRRVVAHHGVDFAAAPGTPITATADGRVVAAGWDGALGVAVRLRHGGEYVTVYGHMQSFARGIAPGVEVLQGQVIGYVGSTGRATGPHLHYTVLRYGRPINPMNMKNPSVDPLEDRMLPWLDESRRRYSPLLAGIVIEPRIDLAATPPVAAATTALSGS
jgi:murein DD-endopeptidase MepM/ murein hydrolase activator NlpD